MSRCERPFVSVVMAAFNGERYIAQAIRSVLGQTFTGWELLVVDDGSTDQTAAVVGSFVNEPRIKYTHQENRGQAAARNQAMDAARGTWLAFLDQDDIWMADKLEKQLSIAHRYSCDVVFSDGFTFEADKVSDESRPFNTIVGKFDGPTMFELLFQSNRIPVLSALVRTAVLQSVGRLEESSAIQNCDDYDMWLRLAAHGARFYGMPDRLVRYRTHPTQASSNILQQRRAELATVDRHVDSPLLNAEMRRKRMHAVYRGLVDELARQCCYTEAKTYVREMRRYQRFPIKGVLQELALAVHPSRYRWLTCQLHRIERLFSRK